MHEELWDTETGNLVQTFACEHEAFLAVHDVVASLGDVYGQALSVMCEDAEGESQLTAEGKQLLERTARMAPHRHSSYYLEPDGAATTPIVTPAT